MIRPIQAFVLFLCSSFAVAADKPAGFENEAVYNAVMAGEIHEQNVVDTKKESRRIFRFYYPKVSPDAFVELATNHPKYPSMFPEVQEAKTTKVNADRTEFECWMKVKVKVGPFTKLVFPETRQKITRGKDAVSEWTFKSDLLNQKENVEFVRGMSRLIPWQGGLLVHMDSHFLLKEQTGLNIIKQKMMEQERREIEAFKKELVPAWLW